MFAFYHSSGFYLTPLTKGLLGSLLLLSVAIIVPLQAYRHWFSYTYSQIFEKHQFHRFLACRSVFLDPKDLICAAVLLYHFRIFERRFGSRKYASYLISTMALACGLELATVYTFHQYDMPVRLGLLPSGPHGFIFALFVPYFCDIPRVAVNHILGVPVTGKSLTYIVGLQMVSSSAESMLLGACGLAAGLLYKANFLFLRDTMLVPSWMGSLFGSVFGWLVDSPAPTDNALPMGATLELQRQEQMERLEQQLLWAQMQQMRPQNAGLFGNHNGAVPNANFGIGVGHAPGAAAVAAAVGEAAAAPPPDGQVQRLVEMGFHRDRVLHALRVTNNDVTMATSILLHES